MLNIVHLHGFQRSPWLSFGLGCDMWPIKRGNYGNLTSLSTTSLLVVGSLSWVNTSFNINQHMNQNQKAQNAVNVDEFVLMESIKLVLFVKTNIKQIKDSDEEWVNSEVIVKWSSHEYWVLWESLFVYQTQNLLRGVLLCPSSSPVVLFNQLSNVQNPYDIPSHWFRNRDRYNGLQYIVQSCLDNRSICFDAMLVGDLVSDDPQKDPPVSC